MESEFTLTELKSSSNEMQSSKSQKKDFTVELQGQLKLTCHQCLESRYLLGIILILLFPFLGILAFFSTRFKKFLFYSVIDNIPQQQSNGQQSQKNDNLTDQNLDRNKDKNAMTQKITHIYVETNEGAQIMKVNFVQKRLLFQFKGLRYQIIKQKAVPLKFSLFDYYRDNKEYLTKVQANINKLGLNEEKVQINKLLYGLNQHILQIPNAIQFFFVTVTQPLYLLQIVFIIVRIIETNIALIILCGCTLIISIQFLYLFYYLTSNKIKELTAKQYDVNVIRNKKIKKLRSKPLTNQWYSHKQNILKSQSGPEQEKQVYMRIKNTQILPGDIYQIKKQMYIKQTKKNVKFIIPVDSILLIGRISTNEVNLSGQNIPISKYPFSQNYLDINESTIFNNQYWLFGDTMVEEIQSVKTYALAVNTGFTSIKGKIIRKLMTNAWKQPQIIRKMLFFYAEVLLIGILIYLFSLIKITNQSFEGFLIFSRFLDVIIYHIPSIIPSFYTLAYIASFMRLRGFIWNQSTSILVTESSKIYSTSQMKHLNLDKTGTLTQNQASLHKLFLVCQDQLKNIKINQQWNFANDNERLLNYLLSSCHNIYCQNFQNNNVISYNLIGDQIQKIFFKYSKAEQIGGNINKKHFYEVLKNIKTVDGHVIQILKIHQFQSKHKSMSIIAFIYNRNNQIEYTYSNKFVVFAKGAIEIIQQNSDNLNNQIEQTLQQIKLKGQRSIAFGYKIIDEKDVKRYIQLGRKQQMKNFNFLGVGVLKNQFKPNAAKIIKQISNADIQCRIITGDDIFVGIKLAYQFQMIPYQSKVYLFRKIIKKQNQNKQYLYQVVKVKYSQITTACQILQISQFFSNHNPTQNKSEPNYQPYLKDKNAVFAMDDQFIQSNRQNFFFLKTIVYGRITPQNKGLIVKSQVKYLQETTQKQKQNAPWYKKPFLDNRGTVGMIGDGMNDQLAQKQADISFGIISSDTTSVTTFVIRNIDQLVEILRQGKSLARQLIEVTLNFSICFALQMLLITIISIYDSTYFFSFNAQNFSNSCLLLMNCVMLVFCKSSTKLSKKRPIINMMSLEYHLVFWGNYIIFGTTFIIGYFYFVKTADFVPNPFPDASVKGQWYSKNGSNTVCILMMVFQLTVQPIILYRGYPWKSKIIYNLPIFIWGFVGISIVLVIYMILPDIFDLVEVSFQTRFTLFVIMLIGTIICSIYNMYIQDIFSKDDNKEAKVHPE